MSIYGNIATPLTHPRMGISGFGEKILTPVSLEGARAESTGLQRGHLHSP
jgi:hypothetical protein